MKDLTEKEYDEFEELLTKTTPKLKAKDTGLFSRGGNTLATEKIATSYNAEKSAKNANKIILKLNKYV